MDSVCVEIVLKTLSKLSKDEAIALVDQYLQMNKIKPNTVISNLSPATNLQDDIEHLVIGDFDCNNGEGYINFRQVDAKWSVYTLSVDGPHVDSDCDSDREFFNLSTQWVLPSAEFFNLWENLYYDNEIKTQLLKYAKSMMEFADKGVNAHIVSCNRVILLHGPPGTGKTSLCRALAQKLSIKMQDRYHSGLMVEINSHSLFSKWFSESAKLVSKMFSRIKEIVENERLLVCVLIDEVESLAHARNQCFSGNEPSDSVRVVNTVLTEIDRIRTYTNVLVLVTSNMTQAIDLAFLDRADIKQYLGLPSKHAIYKIYSTCIQELIRTGIIIDNSDLNIDLLRDSSENCRKLMEVSEMSIGLSGRTLRKIPFLAHALYTKKRTNNLGEFLEAMKKAVENETKERKVFT